MDVIENPEILAEQQLRDVIAFGDEYDPLEGLSEEEREVFKKSHGIKGKMTHWDDDSIPKGHYRAISGQIKKIKTFGKRNTKTKMMYGSKWNPNRGKVAIGTDSKGHPTYLVAVGEQILVQQDKFKENARCVRCEGKGHLFMACQDCGGTKIVNGVACQFCIACSYENPVPQPTGKRKCPDCQNDAGIPQGWKVTKAQQIVPGQVQEEVPTTGIVVSVGEKVGKWKLGDRILYSRYSGQQMEANGNLYRMMSAEYPIGAILGTADIKVQDSTIYKAVS